MPCLLQSVVGTNLRCKRWLAGILGSRLGKCLWLHFPGLPHCCSAALQVSPEGFCSIILCNIANIQWSQGLWCETRDIRPNQGRSILAYQDVQYHKEKCVKQSFVISTTVQNRDPAEKGARKRNKVRGRWGSIAASFPISSGVRQGCVLTPRLFWRRDAPLKGFDLGAGQPALLDLRFADEILLFAKSYAEIVSLLHEYGHCTVESWLDTQCVNKRVVLTNEAQPPQRLQLPSREGIDILEHSPFSAGLGTAWCSAAPRFGATHAIQELVPMTRREVGGSLSECTFSYCPSLGRTAEQHAGDEQE